MFVLCIADCWFSVIARVELFGRGRLHWQDMPPTILPGRPAQANLSVPFNCVVSCGGNAVGGFSAVSGLDGAVRSVVLKRGRISTDDFLAWIKASRYGIAEPRQVTITVRDEARRAVSVFVLRSARPSKWTGPVLAAKGGGDVAMEELTLAHEGIEE